MTEALKRLLLLGGGQHAKVVLEAAQAQGWQIVGFTDPARGSELERLGVPWLGDDASLPSREPDARCVIAVGGVVDTSLRVEIAARMESSGASWATVAHPRAIVSGAAHVDVGAVILAGAIVNPGARIGAHAIINTGAIIEHDVTVGSFAHVGPGAVIGGGASVGTGAYIGLGSRIRDHVAVGDRVVVGMGSVVVRSVPDDAVVVGVPARPLRRKVASLRAALAPGGRARQR